MKKRGVSPLVATVLLIMFIVALVILVMVWGRSFIQELREKQGAISESKLSCETDIEIGVSNAYQQGNMVYITVENKGKRIDSFIVRIIGGSETDVSEVFDSLDPNDVVSLRVNLINVGSVDKVDVIPRIKAGGEIYEACSSKHVVYKI